MSEVTLQSKISYFLNDNHENTNKSYSQGFKEGFIDLNEFIQFQLDDNQHDHLQNRIDESIQGCNKYHEVRLEEEPYISKYSKNERGLLTNFSDYDHINFNEKIPYVRTKNKVYQSKGLQTAVKNYVSVLTRIFAYYFTLAKKIKPQEIQDIIENVLSQTCPHNDKDEMRKKSLKYIEETMSGKNIPNTKTRFKQNKVVSRKDISRVLFEKNHDSEELIAIKEIVRCFILKFFESETFKNWVLKGYKPKNPESRTFLMNEENLNQIILVFTTKKFRPKFI